MGPPPQPVRRSALCRGSRVCGHARPSCDKDSPFLLANSAKVSLMIWNLGSSDHNAVGSSGLEASLSFVSSSAHLQSDRSSNDRLNAHRQPLPYSLCF